MPPAPVRFVLGLFAVVPHPTPRKPVRLQLLALCMKNFAILRLSKLRTLAQVSAAARHNARQGKVAHADPSLRDRNLELVALPAGGLVQAVRQRLPEKVRRNAVRAIEALCATSAPVPDAEAWARASLSYAQDRWGAGNVVAATLHRDEPDAGAHLHLVFVPLVAGRLQGKKTVGNRADLRAMQESYWHAVAGFGLDRGGLSAGRRHLPARLLRDANARATDDDKRQAVALVAILQAELDALRRQAAKLRQAQVRAATFRPPGIVPPRSALAPVPRAQPAQDLGVPAVPRQERGPEL